MTPYQKYLEALKNRPSKEEKLYWASLDTRAAEAQKNAFNAELDASSKKFDQWLKDYDAAKICKSNAIPFDEWEKVFYKGISPWIELLGLVPTGYPLACYENNDQANLAAWKFVCEHIKDEPDPELEIQKAYVKEMTEYLAKQDEVQKARIARL